MLREGATVAGCVPMTDLHRYTVVDTNGSHTNSIANVVSVFEESAAVDNADADLTTTNKRKITDLMTHHEEISQDTGRMQHFVQVNHFNLNKNPWKLTNFCPGENRSAPVRPSVC